MNEHLWYLSIGELHALLRAKETSPVEIVNACLARIETLNPHLNAFVLILAEQARNQAREAEAEIKAGH